MIKYNTHRLPASKEDLKAFVHHHYINNVQGKTIINRQKGIKIQFNKYGRKKTAKSFMTPNKAIGVLNIMELLREAKFFGYAKAKPNHIKNMKAIGQMIFKVTATIDDKPHTFRIRIIITKTGRFQYSLSSDE